MTEEHEVQQRLAEFVGRETEYWDFWGTIRIIKDGKTFWETSRGYSCAEFCVKNTMSTRFTIASVTKQFTAFAIMLLYDRGLLSRFLPGLRCIICLPILPDCIISTTLRTTSTSGRTDCPMTGKHFSANGF